MYVYKSAAESGVTNTAYRVISLVAQDCAVAEGGEAPVSPRGPFVPEVLKTVWTMYWKRWYDCVSCAFHGFFEDEKDSSRLWVCQGIKLQFACIRDISEKGAKNQTLCGPDENDVDRSTGRLQNGLVLT